MSTILCLFSSAPDCSLISVGSELIVLRSGGLGSLRFTVGLDDFMGFSQAK